MRPVGLTLQLSRIQTYVIVEENTSWHSYICSVTECHGRKRALTVFDACAQGYPIRIIIPGHIGEPSGLLA